MLPKFFPLRWESTGDQWWFASPIDWAAANGHYDLVRQLLHIDPNLLIKLTSLPRIRRLETVWDEEEDEKFKDVAKCRSAVAQKLLNECETTRGYNSLIRAGYGGWLLYTAASAGDVIFVKELLDRDPLLVFGEGEYGITDVFYAAARSKSCEIFRVLFDCSVSPRGQNKEVSAVFRWEMMNRAVHAAARGGCVEMLRELLGDSSDVLAFRDNQGSTVLHTAAGRGQVEVVKKLVSSYDIIDSIDDRGNKALNVAAYRGHLAVFKVLIAASPSSVSLTNNYGDTFLHMAVAGFRAPSFRRVDRQMEFMRLLVGGKVVSIEEIINVQNNDGRTALHMAVAEKIQSDVVELLMLVRYIDVNIRDCEGNTPLDILKQRPQSPSSEILMKRLVLAGGISRFPGETSRNALVSHLRMHGIGGSPGTSFRIPDAEIVLHAGIEDSCRSSCEFTSTELVFSGEIEATFASPKSNSSRHKKSSSSIKSTTSRLKMLLRWPRKEKNTDAPDSVDNCSVESCRMCSSSMNSPIPLRQQFSRQAAILPTNKRILSLQGNLASPSSKKKFGAVLTHNVRQVLPRSNLGSPSSVFSESSWSSPASVGPRKNTILDNFSAGPSSLNQSPNLERIKMRRKHGSFNLRSMNDYFCFGGHGMAVDNSIHSQGQQQNQQTLVDVV